MTKELTAEERITNIIAKLIEQYDNYHEGRQFLEDFNKYAIRDIMALFEVEWRKKARELIGEDEPNCDCDYDYACHDCIRNELRAELRSRLDKTEEGK